MNQVKCGQCGLMNFAGAVECRRCGAQFFNQGRMAESEASEEKPKTKKKILKSALRIFGLAGFVIFLWYASLIGTSEPVLLDQKKIVDNAINVLEMRGFDDEVFALRHLTFYRSTDNWWNRKVG